MHILTTEWFDKKGMIELDGHLYHNLNWHLVMVSVLLTQRENVWKIDECDLSSLTTLQ